MPDKAARTYARWLVPGCVVVYLVITFGHFDPVRRDWRREAFPLGPLAMFWRVPDRPTVRDTLRHIRSHTP